MNIYDPPFRYEGLTEWLSYLNELKKNPGNEAEIARVEKIVAKKREEVHAVLISGGLQ